MRRALAAAGALLATAAAAPAAQAAAEATAWRGDAARTGSSPERLPPKLRRAWRAVLPGPATPPLVVRGRVLVAVSAGAGRPEVIAYSARTGRLLWRTQITSELPELAASGGRVFAAGDRGQVDGLDVRTGRSLWSVRLPRAAFCGSPVAEGPTLIVDCASSTDPGTFALDPAGGRTVWSTDDGEGDGAPAIAGGIVVVAGDCARARAHDRTSGAVLWNGVGGDCGGGGALASVHGGLLYVRENRDAASVDDPVLDAGTGARRRLMATDAFPALAGRLGAFMQAGELRVEDLPGGGVRWRSRGDGRLEASPFMVAGRVFVASAAGPVLAFDAASGRLVQRLAIPAPGPSGRRETTAGARRLVVLSGTTLTAFR